MNSMDESNKEISIREEMNRRNKNPEPIRDSMHDLHEQMEKLSKEMHVIKKMIEEQNSSKRKKSLLP